MPLDSLQYCICSTGWKAKPRTYSTAIYEGESIIIYNAVAFVVLLAALSFFACIARRGFLLITTVQVWSCSVCSFVATVTLTAVAPLSICTKEEQLSVIHFFLWSEGVSGDEIHRRLSAQYGGSTINNARYSEMLIGRLKPEIRRKVRGQLSKCIVLLHDNDRPHTAAHTVETLRKLNFEVLAHPPYSPDIATSDCHLFGPLKEALRGCRFTSDQELKEAVHAWLAAQPKTFFFLRA